MKTTFTGQGFGSLEGQTFRPTFEGAQAQRETAKASVISRRNQRRSRRANRSI